MTTAIGRKRLTMKTDSMYDKFMWYLMASSGLGMWVLIAYALYETSGTGVIHG
jgi:hypothetical protein